MRMTTEELKNVISYIYFSASPSFSKRENGEKQVLKYIITQIAIDQNISSIKPILFSRLLITRSWRQRSERCHSSRQDGTLATVGKYIGLIPLLIT
jgi:hypothetical protein